MCKKVYDITVENNSNYLTSSFLVHNSGYASCLLKTLGITYGMDPVRSGFIWERFLGFSELQFIKASDFGFKPKFNLEDLIRESEKEDIENVEEIDIEDIEGERSVEEDPGGVDRY